MVLRIVRLLLWTFWLPLIAWGGASTTATGDVVSWPNSVSAVPGEPFTFTIEITVPQSGSSNVAGVSCFGGGVTFPITYPSLSAGVNKVTVSGVSSPGAATVNCQVLTGVRGVSDNPQITFSVTVNSYLPTDDRTMANSKGDPISTATGELYSAPPADLSLGGPLALEFRRYYASLLAVNGITGGRLGANWTHNFDWELKATDTQVEVDRFGGRAISFTKSGAAWQLAQPEQYAYQLISASNGGYQFLDPRTNLIYTFNSGGGLTAIQDRNGNTLTITRPVNNTSQVSDGLGRALTFTYDPVSGTIVKVADQTGRFVSFAYDSGNLSQFTDANGKVWQYAYGANTAAGAIAGLMTKATLPAGNVPFTQTFDGSGHVATQADSRGNVSNFQYGAGTMSYTDPAGASSTDTSRGYSKFLKLTDPENQNITAVYDNNGRRTSVTDRVGGAISQTYDAASGYLASVTNAAGSKLSYTYTAQTSSGFTFYNLARAQYPDGTATTFAYDANGNMTSATDEAGKVWKFAYTSRGQITSAADPAGRTASFTYNPDGTVATATDAAGNATTYSYDIAGRVSAIKFADGATRTFAYDKLDNMAQTVDERGNTLAFAFNANNKIQSVTDAAGNSRTMSYTGDEALARQTDRAGNSTNFAYDTNDLLHTVTSPAGETFTLNYNSHHKVSAVLDSAGKGVAFGYNQEDALTSVTDGLQRKTSFTLDPQGFPTQITTPLGEVYKLTRDAYERLTSTTDPTGVTTKATFDPRGLATALSVGGLTASYTNDDAGLISGATDPNGNVWAYGRDSAGRLQSITDPLKRTVKYTYDSRNRFATEQTPLGSITFSYDAGGNLTRRRYSDSTDLQYAYDKLDRLVSAPGMQLSYDAESRITGSNGLTIARDADGRLRSIAYAAGKAVTYGYNAAGLLATVNDWIGGSTALGYDAAHQLTSITRPNGRTTTFTYDADGRISTIAEDAGPSISIQRDAAGRIVSESRSQLPAASPQPGQSSLAVDAANQVTAYTYDAMGRVTADGSRQYTWDMASRLTGYSGANGSASATYDGFGQRTSLTAGAATQNFVWNYATDMPSLAVTRNGTADQRYYVYMPDGSLLYAIDAATGARHFYHFDAAGSTTALTDDGGAITDSYAITPYGESVFQYGSTDNPFTWMGKFGVMQDSQTSLYYMRGRYYDSLSARFLSPDAVLSAAPQDVNPYQYAHADPLGHSDPMGTQVSVGGALNSANSAVSSGLSALKSATPEGGSALDAPGGVAIATNMISKGLTGQADALVATAEKNLVNSLGQVGINPGATVVIEDGTNFANVSQANNLANGLKATGQALDAAGKVFDVIKEGVKLNDAIIAAQNVQAANASATDAAEASFLHDLWTMHKSGKLTKKQYVDQAKAYLAGTYEQQQGGITAMTYEELIAGAKFTQNCLVSLASSAYTKGGKAVKGGLAATSAFWAKGAAWAGTWLGSLWSGTNVNAK